MSNTITRYATAVITGDMDSIKTLLSDSVTIMPPGSNTANEGKGKNTMMLSAVASAINDFTFVRSYESDQEWYAVLLQGTIDGMAVQFIDQVHFDEKGLVDHVDIFLRPASMAASLLEKVSAEIKKRTTS